MSSERALFRSEVLFYIQNNVACVPRDIIISTLCGFFNEDEIVEAKNVLFAVAAATEANESLPRHRVRRGDGRQRADAGDILELWEALDSGKADLPVFVAADQKRIPPITVSDSDVCVMSVSMMEMKVQLKELAKSQQQLADTIKGMQRKLFESTKSAISEAINSSQEFPPIVHAANESPTVQVNSASWSTLAEEVAASGGIRTQVSKTNASTSYGRKTLILRGKRVTPVSGEVGSVKAIPRRITAFVGRLHSETTEESLKNFLLDAGFQSPYCRKLVDKNNKFKTAAFMVSCDSSCRDLFYNESSWPAGCELRDWIFYNRENKPEPAAT